MGKIASMASPMNFSTSPPWACTGSAMAPNQSFRVAITSSRGSASDMLVKPLRSQYHSAAAMVAPSPRLTSPESTRCRSEEHTSELQSLMRISYAVFCLKKKKPHHTHRYSHRYNNTYTPHRPQL